MATLRNYIIGMAGLCLLTQCNDEKASEDTLPTSFHPPLAHKQNSLAGQWKYSNTIYYSAELRLNSDGTFDYQNETCYGQSFTEGKWKENDGSIVLRSDDGYRPVENAKSQGKQKETRLRKGQLIFTGFDETDRPIIPGPNDTIRVYFNSVLLNLKGDTLYSASDNKYIAEHKFSRMQDNR